MDVTLGVDIGTSSSKGVLVDTSGRVIREASRTHSVARPRPGHVEMAPELWWSEFVEIAGELTAGGDNRVVAIGVSGMGPCLAVTDAAGAPLRPAILYGIDTRATREIAELTERYGATAILDRGGSALSSQAVGPKLAWLAREEPAVAARARRFFMPASWLAFRLTGAYTLDLHSASQCSPLFDRAAMDWFTPWASEIAPSIELPPLAWPGDVAGRTTAVIAGIPAGTPVVTGSIDAWTEALSVGAQRPGDLMLMYGTTMFLVATGAAPITAPGMWGTVGALPGTWNLAGGMATSGAITGWLRELTGAAPFAQLIAEAEASGPGARGLLMLPYFAGERTPIMDPDARGTIAGLTLSHTRGDLYRAALEATALGVRHNVETMLAAGVRLDRIVAVGGGTRGGLWTRIVSDVTGLAQVVPSVTIGASYGAAWLAANAVGQADIDVWNPPAELIEPNPARRDDYDELYRLYRALQPALTGISHTLAERQRRLTPATLPPEAGVAT